MSKTKKIFVALTITVMMAGCSSEPAAPVKELKATTVPTEAMSMPNEAAPKPDEAQSEKLLADLGNVSPALNKPVSVEKARAVCEDILAGKNDAQLTQRVSAVFSSDSDGVLSELQTADILKVINSSGFCK